ncbi:MAG: 30S ribosome-binding factor RbfA [Verrucomicrobiales bacterium]|nr:30S ribosome-binding factor RbfA [Verrucomicrobiales bacterium]
MKNRLPRVNELIQRELGTILQRDFDFSGILVTVNAVDITPDLRHCHVYIGVIGGEPQQNDAVAQLNEKHGLIQRRLMSRIVLKRTPQLHFKLDHSVERGVRVTRIMQEIDEQIGPDAWKELLPEPERD